MEKPSHPDSRRAALIRAFPLLWGGLTAVYACTVLYRFALHGRPPSLSTLAASAAITTVWIEFVALVRREIVWRLAGMVSLLITIAANAVVSVAAIVAGQDIPIARLFFTLLFLLVFIDRVLHLPVYR